MTTTPSPATTPPPSLTDRLRAATKNPRRAAMLGCAALFGLVAVLGLLKSLWATATGSGSLVADLPSLGLLGGVGAYLAYLAVKPQASTPKAPTPAPQDLPPPQDPRPEADRDQD